MKILSAKKKTNSFYLKRCSKSFKGNEINGYYTSRYKFKNNNNETNILDKRDSNSQFNTLKKKPKIIIDAYNSNKTNIIAKNNSHNFYKDIEKIKNFQIAQNKNKNIFKKQPYFHILNEQSIQKNNNN